MSYILDALKKAEKERQQGRVPDLQAVHGPPADQAGRRRAWPALVLVALLVNAGLLLWWFAPWRPPEPEGGSAAQAARRQSVEPELPAQLVPAAAAPASNPFAASPRDAENSRSRHEEGEAGAGPVTPGTTASAAETALPEPRNRLYALEELPRELRESLPPLDISLHYYTARASSRMVRIDGRNLREGESWGAGLALDEITPDGVILRCRAYRFQVRDL